MRRSPQYTVPSIPRTRALWWNGGSLPSGTIRYLTVRPRPAETSRIPLSARDPYSSGRSYGDTSDFFSDPPPASIRPMTRSSPRDHMRSLQSSMRRGKSLPITE